MKNLQTIKAFYRLVDTKSLGLSMAHRLVSELGDPTEYVGKNSKHWAEVNYLKPEVLEALQHDTDPRAWEKIANFIENLPNFKFITVLDDEYPECLKNIYQPPLFLTAFGDITLLKCDDIISIVGTRKPTYYGKKVTEKIAQSLVLNQFIVCSGLALGIDSAAHKATIENNGLTIAVLAGGLNSIYPPQNKDLANKIVENGLIISENMPCLPFEKYHFPQRNRIIAGISKAVCVIEGKRQSGALGTGRYALEQGREVYALPGDIFKPEAEGPNSLILQGAKIILTPQDIVTDFRTEYHVNKPEKVIDLTDEEKIIFNIIKDNSPEIHMDQLIQGTGYSIGKMSGVLLLLEMKNAIRTTESGKYSIT